MVFNKDDNDDNNDGEDDDNNDEVPHAPEPFCSWNDGLSVDDDSDAGDETDPFNRNIPKLPPRRIPTEGIVWKAPLP